MTIGGLSVALIIQNVRDLDMICKFCLLSDKIPYGMFIDISVNRYPFGSLKRQYAALIG